MVPERQAQEVPMDPTAERVELPEGYGTATTTIQLTSGSGFWRSNAAITQLTLVPASGNFVSGSLAVLYGVS